MHEPWSKQNSLELFADAQSLKTLTNRRPKNRHEKDRIDRYNKKKTNDNELNQIWAQNPVHIDNVHWNNIVTNIDYSTYNWHLIVLLNKKSWVNVDQQSSIRTTNTIDRCVIWNTLTSTIRTSRIVNTMELNDTSISFVWNSRIDDYE